MIDIRDIEMSTIAVHVPTSELFDSPCFRFNHGTFRTIST
jgi:hypothetical protein